MPVIRLLAALLALALVTAAPAAAQIALDRLIVELPPQQGATVDVEVRNQGEATAYVAIEAAEVLAAGTPDERRLRVADPDRLGLLAAPSRLILEPGARRIVRLARLDPPGAEERIWRVAVRPVSGPTESDTNALQVLVGYGVLVIARPEDAEARIVGERAGDRLALSNAGNTNALLYDGRQCDSTGSNCVELPARRLYPGNRWQVGLRWDTPVVFRVEGPDGVRERSF